MKEEGSLKVKAEIKELNVQPRTPSLEGDFGVSWGDRVMEGQLQAGGAVQMGQTGVSSHT